jgi:hypothetical protein
VCFENSHLNNRVRLVGGFGFEDSLIPHDHLPVESTTSKSKERHKQHQQHQQHKQH